MAGKHIAAALLALLLAAACTDPDAFERSAQAAAKRLDRLLGVDTTPRPAATPAPPPSKSEAFYEAGLAARRAGRDESAATHFRKAAERGHAAASYELGRAYTGGRGVPRDLGAGAKWLNLAADRGEPRAQYLVGAAFYSGTGVDRDRERAARYLAEAATQGHAEAQYLLAKAFANGEGVPKDPAWAARWYAKAARQGQLEAQYAMGVVLSAGYGRPADPTAGYTWILIAAERGHPEAAELRPALAERLSPGQRREAEARAAAFTPRSTGRFADPPTVAYLQVTLNRLGFPAGAVDGRLGPRTRRAIRAYQKSAGLPVDGRLTPRLLERLLSDSRG